jgi:uncharacterized protein YggE
MRKSFLLVVLGVFIIGSLAACQGIAPSQEPVNFPQINVSGTGKVYLVPDIAYVYIGVRSQAGDVASALNQNSAQAQAIASTLRERNVAADDIQTTAFNVYPQQQYTPTGEPGETIYVVENTVFVKIRDLQNLGVLLDAVVRSGANTINGISFDIEDRTSAEAEARRLAVEDAKAKAAELAGLAGVELGELYSVSVYSSGGAMPVFEAKGGGAAYDSAAPIAAGQLVIQADASMTYKINQ